jgi:hypothetical protein
VLGKGATMESSLSFDGMTRITWPYTWWRMTHKFSIVFG